MMPDGGVKSFPGPWLDLFQSYRIGVFPGEEVLRGTLHPWLDPRGPEVEAAIRAWGGEGYLAGVAGGEHELVLLRSTRAPDPMRPMLHLGLLALTLFTTMGAGGMLAGLDPLQVRMLGMGGWWIPVPTGVDFRALIGGWSFAFPFLIILLGHEMGHYVAARRHRIRVTLPFFIPFPPTLSVVGTLGAFIRLRSPMVRRSHLFDVGAAGPVVSLLLSIPILWWGLALSGPIPGRGDGWTPYLVRFLGESIWIGDSLLVRGTALLALGGGVGPEPILLHPLAFAGWLGLLVTALNLLPLGQLDGGHILHALSPSLQRRVGHFVVLALIPLGFAWWGWWLWGMVILAISRRRVSHPPVLQEVVPLDPLRRRLARVAIVVFLITFVPVPLRL